MEWIASLFASLIGACVGATAANMFAQRREFRQEAMKLILKVFKDAHAFKGATIRHLHANDSIAEAKQLVDQRDASNGWTSDDERHKIIDRLEGLRTEARTHYMEYLDTHTELEADCLALGLVFENKALDSVKVIRDFYTSEKSASLSVSEYEVRILNTLLVNVRKQISLLWQTIRNATQD